MIWNELSSPGGESRKQEIFQVISHGEQLKIRQISIKIIMW